ncbi:unnamed protein product [Pieris macdunnoughi]|uniref:Tesmin/TSO1-like CXC domain-containing protein n=1 Tax=Pieris macdunnoughi TaxID=345717 RepID=A0A821XXW4_9NEOP|nr:unnamed protein product [Pieris macdunnoughi]
MTKHSEVSQVKRLSRLLGDAFKNYLLFNKECIFRAATFTTFSSDLISRQCYFWKAFLFHLLQQKKSYSRSQLSAAPAPPELLKLISCKCKGKCGAAGISCSVIGLHCSGQTCDNVAKVEILFNDDHDDEDYDFSAVTSSFPSIENFHDSKSVPKRNFNSQDHQNDEKV